MYFVVIQFSSGEKQFSAETMEEVFQTLEKEKLDTEKKINITIEKTK